VKKNIELVKNNGMTGAQFLMHWDEEFVDDMLSETGNLFAQSYYDEYTDDFCDIFNDKAMRSGFEYKSLYHVEDTQEN